MSRASLQPRRRPQQARSQQRVESILAATQKLVGERGTDAVSVREIAAKAGIPIASVYQYFPSKDAILRQLMERYLARIAERLAGIYSDLKNAGDLKQANDRGVDAMVDFFTKEKALASIWAGVMASPNLRALDDEDAWRTATFLASASQKLVPGIDSEELLDACYLFAHIGGFLAGLVATGERDKGQRLIREFKRILRLRVDSFPKRASRSRKKR